jgi:hypothetical protein
MSNIGLFSPTYRLNDCTRDCNRQVKGIEVSCDVTIFNIL